MGTVYPGVAEGLKGGRRGAGGGPERYVDVFEEMARSDTAQAIGRLDQVVAGLAGMFAAQDVGEDERSCESTGVHKEASAVGGPWSWFVHGNPFPR
jgi:hypothetical protein